MFYCPYLYTIPQTWWWRDVNVMICQKLSNMRLWDVTFSQKLRQFFYDRNETKRGISNFSCRKTFFTFWNLDIDLMQSWSFNHVYTSTLLLVSAFYDSGIFMLFSFQIPKNLFSFDCIIHKFNAKLRILSN